MGVPQRNEWKLARSTKKARQEVEGIGGNIR